MINTMEVNTNQAEINAAFKTGVQDSRSDGCVFTQKKAETVAMAVVGKMKDAAGNNITLNENQKSVFQAMFYPTNVLRMNVIESTLKDAGVELDDTTRALLTKLLNPTGVQKALEAMDNPEKKTLRDFLS